MPARAAEPGTPPDRPRLPTGLVDAAVDRAAGRRRVRQALGVPSDRRISDEVIDELLAGASTEEEIAGPGGLLAELTRRLVERAMEVALTDHVGYEPHCEPLGGTANTRNGTTPKTLITEHGKVVIDAPRDRDGSFEPKIVRNASGGSSGSTTRSSPSTAEGCRSATSGPTWPRSTASRSASI